MLNQSEVVVSESSGVRECLRQLAVRKEQLRPLSTYRLQFNHAFRFNDARALIGYLHELGVSTCYASPILKARAGSTHGYDIIDHNAINPELGTEEELDELAAELKSYRMGLLLDVVPNHMGVGYARTYGGQTAVVATPRFACTMLGGKARMPLGEVWGAAEIVLPPTPPGTSVKNLLTGEVLPIRQQTLLCQEVFASFPLGLLLS